MATYEGTVDYFLREHGSRCMDFDLNEGSDGERLTRARSIELINLAQKTVHRRIRRSVNAECLTRRATLTQDSSDTTIWYMPLRAIGVGLSIEDSNTTIYNLVATPLEVERPGVYLQNRAGTVGKQLFFKDVTPDTTVYVKVIEEPVLMSSGTNAATSATSITLATTPGVGRNINDNDYYANSEVRITSGNDTGDLKTITSSTALLCQVASWTTATPATTTDTYSIQCSLPREAWDAVSAEAARLQLRTDKELIDLADEIIAEAERTVTEAILEIARPYAGMVKEPRQTVFWIR